MKLKSRKTLLALAISQLLVLSSQAATDPDGDPARSSEWLNDIDPDYPVAAVIEVENKYIDQVVAKIKNLSISLTKERLQQIELGPDCPISAEPHLVLGAEPHSPVDAEPHFPNPVDAEPHKPVQAELHKKYCSPISVDAYLNPQLESLSESIEIKQVNGKHNYIALSGYRDELEELSMSLGVTRIVHDPRRYMFHHTSSSNYQRSLVQADKAHSNYVGTTPDEYTSNMNICVIDTGLDTSHPAFSGMNITGTDMTTIRVGSTPTDWNTDDEAHGTHVSGTIAAQSNQSTRYSDAVPLGVTPNGHTNIHMVKVTFGSRGTNIGNAIDECVRNNANIINMSLGGDYPSYPEQVEAASAQNVLLIAAAGNDGAKRLDDERTPDIDAQTWESYPASYPEVISVAAVDESSIHANYSQRNASVELSAPGTRVVSTIPPNLGVTYFSEFLIDNIQYPHSASIGRISVNDVATLPSWYQENMNYNISNFVDCGNGGNTCPSSSQSSDWGCLIERGGIGANGRTLTFREKALNCELAGGSYALIYNNIVPRINYLNEDRMPSPFLGDIQGAPTIPVFGSEIDFKDIITRSQTNRINRLGADPFYPFSPTLFKTLTSYDYMPFTGTSMATPVVSGVAALLWSHHTSCTAGRIREALTDSAKDLGTAGRDHKYGFGIVQYLAAEDWIDDYGC